MKYLLALMLIAFVAIGVFGFVAMEHGSPFSKCVAAVIPGGMACMQNDLSMGLLHAKIYKSFSFGILSAALLLLVIFAIASITSVLQLISEPRFSAPNVELNENNSFRQKLNHWLSLLEKKEDTLS